MTKLYFLFLFQSIIISVFAQNTNKQQRKFKREVNKYYTPEYLSFREKIGQGFINVKPGKFGMFVSGTVQDVATDDKVMAFTFDACIGHTNDYNADLISFLKQEKIPATLFISGIWIDANQTVFKDLASNPLFEIENHGLLHRLCSLDGETKYGIAATENTNDVIDEMELNARKIQGLTGKRPQFFRSATTYTNESCSKIAEALGMKIVSFDILSGDAVPFTPAETIAKTIIDNARHGAIVIMHFNHPLWYERKALEIAIPVLRSKGYKFVTLENHPLRNKND